MRRRGMIKTIGVLAAAIVVTGFVMYVIVQPTVGWPDESRRQVHPAGFSIVKPDGWEQHATFTSAGQPADGFKFLPAKAVGSPGYFNLTRLTVPVTEADRNAKGYTPTTFADQPAWEKLAEHTFTKEHSRSLIFERDGQWFEISIRRPDSEPFIAGVWRAYAESFKIEPVKTLATTLPATLPVSQP
ncbi:MAG: hypothetical protein JWM57_4134 [Phycisphaerales bacterium]|nr:hypothetical protein [Phycisphaerales bacterium]